MVAFPQLLRWKSCLLTFHIPGHNFWDCTQPQQDATEVAGRKFQENKGLMTSQPPLSLRDHPRMSPAEGLLQVKPQFLWVRWQRIGFHKNCKELLVIVLSKIWNKTFFISFFNLSKVKYISFRNNLKKNFAHFANVFGKKGERINDVMVPTSFGSGGFTTSRCLSLLWCSHSQMCMTASFLDKRFPDSPVNSSQGLLATSRVGSPILTLLCVPFSVTLHGLCLMG